MTEGTGEAPWPGHEYVRGWGVFGLPFDSGHVLALRVFPQNSFAPYRSVWHRDPDGRWSIFTDAPRLDVACPRYYGAACEHTGPARIGLTWTGPRTLRVAVDRPGLDWTLTARASTLLRVLNALGAALPPATWKPPSLVRVRERMARGLGLGRLQLSGIMPSGHWGILMPQRMFYVDQATATLGGVDLGRPTHLRTNPTIGDVPLPARGVLSVGQAMWRIRDLDEFERTRAEVHMEGECDDKHLAPPRHG
jgi:hypothetical protein